MSVTYNIYRKSRCHRQIPPFTESKNQIQKNNGEKMMDVNTY